MHTPSLSVANDTKDSCHLSAEQNVSLNEEMDFDSTSPKPKKPHDVTKDATKTEGAIPNAFVIMESNKNIYTAEALQGRVFVNHHCVIVGVVVLLALVGGIHHPKRSSRSLPHSILIST